MPYPRDTLIIMAKRPRLGAVKTRLGRDVGMAEATRLYRAWLSRLAWRLRGHGFDFWLAVSPDGWRPWQNTLPVSRVVPQGRGDLGQRMARQLAATPPGRVCLIGADIPDIRVRHIRQAFAALNRSPFVIGPAPDGGYWLIGQRRDSVTHTPQLKGIRWSSEFTRLDTLDQLSKAALVESLTDIDIGADLVRHPDVRRPLVLPR